MKLTIKVLIFIILAECLAPSLLFAKKKRRKRTPEKTEIKSEIIYRQVSVGHRRQSYYYKEARSADFVDQLYLTTRLDRSYDYRYQLVVRAYDDGIAFRYVFPEQEQWKTLNLAEEKTDFHLIV